MRELERPPSSAHPRTPTLHVAIAGAGRLGTLLASAAATIPDGPLLGLTPLRLATRRPATEAVPC